jgi:hypothetical protein
MRVRQVKPHEIPLRLLKQKKVWDLKVFYEFAMTGAPWTAYLLGEDDDPWGAVILEDSPLAMAVFCQTIIVDKTRRTPENVMAAAIYAHEATLEKARVLGRPYAGCGVQNPEKFLEILGNPPTAKIVEHVVREEV